MQGTAGRNGNPKASDPVERESSRGQAVVAYFPPTDFLNYGGEGKHFDHYIRRLLDGKNPYLAALDFHSHDREQNWYARITDEGKVREQLREAAQRKGRRYCLILEQRKQILRQIMSILAQQDGLPAIVHCRAGKDRAGIGAALVLGIAGVPRETIVEDYILTARYLIVRDLEQNPDLSPEEYTWKDFQDAGCPPATIELTLDHLEARYGGITGYLKDVGVTQEQLDSIRSAMTE